MRSTSTIRVTVMLMLMSIVATPLFGQTGTTRDSIALVAAEHRWADANVACDTSAMASILADSIMFVHTDGAADGKRAYLTKVAGCQIARAEITPTSMGHVCAP